VWINTHIPLVAEMPHGGFKHSGYGKDLSMYGFEDYTRIKHVMANLDTVGAACPRFPAVACRRCGAMTCTCFDFHAALKFAFAGLSGRPRAFLFSETC
jgi:hypothetical protein